MHGNGWVNESALPMSECVRHERETKGGNVLLCLLYTFKFVLCMIMSMFEITTWGCWWPCSLPAMSNANTTKHTQRRGTGELRTYSITRLRTPPPPLNEMLHLNTAEHPLERRGAMNIYESPCVGNRKGKEWEWERQELKYWASVSLTVCSVLFSEHAVCSALNASGIKVRRREG